MSYHKITLLLFAGLLAISALQSCSEASGTWKNNNIDPDIKTEIHQLSKKLYTAVFKQDIKAVKSLMSAELVEQAGDSIQGLVKKINKEFKPVGKYVPLEEYYIRNYELDTITHDLVSDTQGDKGYTLSYTAFNKEMYLDLLIIKGTNGDVLLTTMYGKEEGQWKLFVMQLGQYTVFGKTAPDYFKLAQDSYDKGHFIDAADYIIIATLCSRPADKYLKYQKDGEMEVFFNRVLTEVNSKYKFPFVIKEVETKPSVFRIYPEFTGTSIAPVICYMSKIKIKDSVALKNEYNIVKRQSEKLFPGIAENNKYIMYKAVNVLPDGKNIEYYNFIDTLKK